MESYCKNCVDLSLEKSKPVENYILYLRDRAETKLGKGSVSHQYQIGNHNDL